MWSSALRFFSFITDSRLTLAKKVNAGLTKFQYKILKSAKLYSYPLQLTICPGNVCNLKCSLCPTGTLRAGRKKGFLTFELFKKIVDECAPYLCKIELVNWGEPFLNKQLFTMIGYAKQKGLAVESGSNLNFFNAEICENIVRSGLDKLTVSLDGASQRSVGQYQKGADFGKVVGNLKKLMQKKRELKSRTPFVQWRFLINKYNEKEIPRARELAKEIGVDLLEFGPFRCDMGQELLLDDKAQFAGIKSWLPKEEKLSMYDYSKHGKKVIQTQPCYMLWTQAVINWDGSVAPCCAVWQEKFDFGNINHSSFFEIWNNQKYQAARKLSRRDAAEPSDNICYICKANQAQL